MPETVKGYCLKCKKQQPMNDGKLKTTTNGRKMMTGTCKSCGTKMCKFMSSK